MMTTFHLEQDSDRTIEGLPPDWLSKRITVEEAERAHLVKDERLGPESMPFGSINAQWKALLDDMTEGDELWEVSSSLESWRHRAGIEGIALVRNGQIIAMIPTKVS